MALPKDKKLVADLVLPEVDIVASSRGLTVTASERLATPRFVPFTYPGRCRDCKGTAVTAQGCITKEGVTLFSNRIKGSKFVPFDSVYDLPDTCFFRVKCFGQIYNIPHNSTIADNPMVLAESGAVKRAHDQMPIDGFLKPKRAKTESSDPDIQFVDETTQHAFAKQVPPAEKVNPGTDEEEKENVQLVDTEQQV